jgi:hypothetical protein
MTGLKPQRRFAMIEEELRCVIADLQEQCKRKDEEIAILKRMTNLMAKELNRLEISPPVCEGCKQIEGYGRYCEGKECFLWMFERAAKGLFDYGLSK